MCLANCSGAHKCQVHGNHLAHLALRPGLSKRSHACTVSWNDTHILYEFDTWIYKEGCGHTVPCPLQGGGVTLYCVYYKEEGSHSIVPSTRRRGHTVLYHLQGREVTHYCIVYKEEGSLSIVSSTRRRGHSVFYHQQGGEVTQYCIIHK